MKAQSYSFENHLLVDENHTLAFTELPKGRTRKPCFGMINSRQCVVFRKTAPRTTLKYLAKVFPLIQDLFPEVGEHAASILNCLVEHGQAVVFRVVEANRKQEYLAVFTKKLWESSTDDLTYCLNMLHYAEACSHSICGAFADDYGLW